jgi:predicted ATPase
MSEWSGELVTFLLAEGAGAGEAPPVPFRNADRLQTLSAAVRERGGRVFRDEANVCHAAFTTAPMALAAALAVWRPRDDLPPAVKGMRVALHTGIVDGASESHTGPALARAQALLAAGYAGQILVTQSAAERLAETPPKGDVPELPGQPGLRLHALGAPQLVDLAPPEPLYQVSGPDLPGDFPPLRTLERLPGNLSAFATTFVGRVWELAELRMLLQADDGPRLVTLTGAGGTGKSRLALQAAAGLYGAFPDGVYVVPLAAVRLPGLALPAVAQALRLKAVAGQPLAETLAGYLRQRTILLVLDDFDQALGAGGLVARLLETAPGGSRVVVTSRARLHVAGEHELALEPLGLPHWREGRWSGGVRGVVQSEAVRLFAERARMAAPGFRLREDNAGVIAEICARLDGLPLAIELAAARCRQLAPAEILAQLASPLALAAGPGTTLPARQQTLRSTMDWSYHLLGAREQRVLAQCAVFHGGFTPEAAGAVLFDQGVRERDAASFASLDSLVDKSLLRYDKKGERYTLLEVIREYAHERLIESGERAVLCARHARYFEELVAAAEPELTGARQLEWLNRLEVEHANLRAALEWRAAEGPPESLLEMAGNLGRFWINRGYLSEGRRWLDQALAATPVLNLARIKALNTVGTLSQQQGDYARAQALYLKALALARELGEERRAAHVLNNLGTLAMELEDARQAQTYYEDGLALYRALDDRYGVASLLLNLGRLAIFAGDHASVAACCQESLTIFRELGVTRGVAYALNNLGASALEQGDVAGAQSCFDEALALVRELGETRMVAYCLEGLGGVAVLRGDVARAGRLLGAAEAVRETLAIPLAPAERVLYDRYIARARTLDAQAFAAAWAVGKWLTPEQVLGEPGADHV